MSRPLNISELRILDHAGDPVGGYYLATVFLDRYRSSTSHDGLVDLTVDVLLLEVPAAAVEPIWNIWVSGGPPAPNGWAEPEPPADTTTWRRAWLHVARIHAARERRTSRYPSPDVTYTLDGTYVTDLDGLWCALGEAVNGPGGYFGTDLHSVRDCLSGGFGLTLPSVLVWSRFGVATAHVPPAELAELLDLLAACRVRVEHR